MGALRMLRRIGRGGAKHTRRRLGRRAVAAVEFAIVAPLLVTLVLGLYDISQALLIKRRVALAALEIAETASTFAVQANTATNQLTNAQVWTSDTAAFLHLPGMRANSAAGTADANYAITISSVQFSPKSTGSNTYNAHVAWSSYATNGLKNLRACDVPASQGEDNNNMSAAKPGLAPASSNDIESLSTLPPSAYLPPSTVSQPYPLIVADVQYTYVPLFSKFITGNITFFRSRFVSPRIGTSDAYVRFIGTTSGNVQVTLCP